MAQAFLIQKSGGGGVNQTLPAQVTAFHAAANSTPAVVLTWTNPTEHFGGVLIVKKIGTAPTSPTDGVKIYSGTAETFTDADVQFDTEYFYRAFAYNEKKQYQTLYAVASAKPLSGIALSSLAEGALVNIMEDGAAVPFYLAKHDYESGLNGAGRQLLVRKDCYDERVWNPSEAKRFHLYYVSNIDTWLNSDYKALFSASVQAMMGTTTFYSATTAPSDGRDGGQTVSTTISRSIFLASKKELGFNDKYADIEGSVLPISSKLKIAYLDGTAVSQWTRNFCTRFYYWACYVDSDGKGGSTTYSYSGTVTDNRGSRPCFTLPADALVYSTPNADGSYTLIEEVA